MCIRDRIEAVDVNTGQPIPYGEAGEIVITSLTKEAFPVIRYRTRDVSVLDPAPCRCGRTHVRICLLYTSRCV